VSADAIGIVAAVAVIAYLALHFITKEIRDELRAQGAANRKALQNVTNKLDGVIHYVRILNDKTPYPPNQSPLDD
jgi:hypothetical protein